MVGGNLGDNRYRIAIDYGGNVPSNTCMTVTLNNVVCTESPYLPLVGTNQVPIMATPRGGRRVRAETGRPPREAGEVGNFSSQLHFDPRYWGNSAAF